MRYKVKAPNEELYNQIHALLEGEVPIFVASEKRRVLSTGDIPDLLMTSIKKLGASVTTDLQYDLEIPEKGRTMPA